MDSEEIQSAARTAALCADCGQAIPAGAPGGHCPRCLMAEMLPSVRGRRFGEYELLEELARGGMGVVYRARHVELNRVVALKMILAGQLANAEEVRRFRSEAEAAARLDHPNIVPIYTVGEREGWHFFTMKLIEGGSLAECLDAYVLPGPGAKPGRIRAEEGQHRRSEELAGLLLLVSRAVHHAHGCGVLHRDLKPANILIDPQGQPHVTDFGLARRLEGDSGATQSGQILGSPDYMAPEQASGRSRAVTTGADIYGLGAILYHLLTGRPPFRDETMIVTLRNVVEKEPPRPRSLNPGVALDLETICLKCLEKDPGRRYLSAGALADDLERWLRGEPIAARQVSVGERSWKWIGRHPLRAGALLTLFVVVSLAVAGITWQWKKADRAHAVALRANAELSELVNRLRFDRAEDLFARGMAQSSLPLLALILEQNPGHREAATRLIAALETRRFGLPVLELGHSNFVRFAEFSPDGGMIVTASDDGTSRLWRTATGEPVGDVMRHENRVNMARFSPDGRRLATASEDGTARLWEVETGKLMTTLRHGDDVNRVEFSPDGRLVVTASADRTAQIWDAVDGSPVGPPLRHDRTVNDARFSPDGTKVVTAGNDRVARVWSVPDGRKVGVDWRHEDSVKCAVFSPDSERVATASWDGTVRVWSVATGLSTLPPLVHSERAVAVSFDAAGRRLVTVSTDGSACVWDAATGRALTSHLRHGARVRHAEFSPDGGTVATASGDSSVRLWDAATGELRMEPLLHNGPVHRVRFHPSGRTLLTASEDGTARLWRLPDPGRATGTVFLEAGAPVRRLVVSPDGGRLATLVRDAVLQFWDAQSGRAATEGIQFSNRVQCLSFDRSGTRLLVGGEDRCAWVLDSGTGASLCSPAVHEHAVVSVAFSPDGGWFATGSDDGTARVWDARSGQPLTPPLRHPGRVASVAFSPDGSRLATGSSDGAARIWEVRAGILLGEPLPHPPGVDAVQFSPDGQVLAIRGKDGAVRLWDMGTRKPRPFNFAHHQGTDAAGFSPDGELLFTISRSDQSVQLWRAKTGLPAAPPIRVERLIKNAYFSPDGQRIATPSDDTTVRVWDTRSALPMSEPLRHDSKVNAVVFTRDGLGLLTACEDGKVWKWAVPVVTTPAPDWLPKLAQVLSGARADASGNLVPVPIRDYFNIRREMVAAAALTNEFYGRWAAEFLGREGTGRR